MNILPKKKWHVRTKENMARVRRDEAKAAEEEKRRLDRAILAENERRMQALRSIADERMETMFGMGRSSPSNKDSSIFDETGHVNFFQDLEREERKNLGTGNKEYEEEKKKEQHEWESKMGIQKMFAEGTNEFEKKTEWYEKLPLRTRPEKSVQPVSTQHLKEGKYEKSKERKHKKKKKEKRKHYSSDSSDNEKKKKKKSKKRDRSEEQRDEEAEKKRKLQAMREERIKREREERLRQEQLLHPERFKPPPETKQKYNSQFNPDIARR